MYSAMRGLSQLPMIIDDAFAAAVTVECRWSLVILNFFVSRLNLVLGRTDDVIESPNLSSAHTQLSLTIDDLNNCTTT